MILDLHHRTYILNRYILIWLVCVYDSIMNYDVRWRTFNCYSAVNKCIQQLAIIHKFYICPAAELSHFYLRNALSEATSSFLRNELPILCNNNDYLITSCSPLWTLAGGSLSGWLPVRLAPCQAGFLQHCLFTFTDSIPYPYSDILIYKIFSKTNYFFVITFVPNRPWRNLNIYRCPHHIFKHPVNLTGLHLQKYYNFQKNDISQWGYMVYIKPVMTKIEMILI